MSSGDCLAGGSALRDVNEAGLLRVAQLRPLCPVIPDGGSNCILGEHYTRSKSATTRLRQRTR